MTVDLMRYISMEESTQPAALTTALRRLVAVLRGAEEQVAWEQAVQAYMVEASGWIGTGLLDGSCAAGALFVGHTLLAGHRAHGREGGLRILGFALQLSMSEAEWAGALQAMSRDGAGVKDGDSKVLRVHSFPETVLSYLFKRGERDILREIFLGARLAIDAVARRAMREARDFDGWLADLSVLAAYLTMRRWLPLKVKSAIAGKQGGQVEVQMNEDGMLVGGRFVPPPEDDHPVLAHLFERAETESLHRKEAFAAECFAHLFTSVVNGWITVEHQRGVAAEYARRAVESRLDARQWLSLGKSRFQIAPYT